MEIHYIILDAFVCVWKAAMPTPLPPTLHILCVFEIFYSKFFFKRCLSQNWLGFHLHNNYTEYVHHYAHFTDEEKDTERLNHFPKIIQLVTDSL